MRIRIFFIGLDRRIMRRFARHSVRLWPSIARRFYAERSGCMGVAVNSVMDAVATPA